MKWQKKLTKKELRHIKETTTHGTLANFKVNRKAQTDHMKETGEELCFECRFIAQKLGLEASQ